MHKLLSCSQAYLEKVQDRANDKDMLASEYFAQSHSL